MRIIRAIFALVLAVCVSGGTVYNDAGSRHFYWVGTVPTSATSIVGGTVYLVHGSFSTGGSSGTITISSRGTDCTGSTACNFSTAVTIAANTTYEMDFGSAIAPSGLNIIATGTVTATIHWVTQVIP
jgi:hypothetical protein